MVQEPSAPRGGMFAPSQTERGWEMFGNFLTLLLHTPFTCICYTQSKRRVYCFTHASFFFLFLISFCIIFNTTQSSTWVSGLNFPLRYFVFKAFRFPVVRFHITLLQLWIFPQQSREGCGGKYSMATEELLMEERSMNFTPLYCHRLEINMLLAIPFVPQPLSTLATYHIFQGHPPTPSPQLPNRYKQHHTSHKNCSA